ncbi:MAG TPA: 50S ribosomal protein L6 [Gammaproteobacteria bacterium]|jgi:large subunit ribosomal protein L6|nr:50S ribosomal protein L6 [Gammaproteobacteria bacterium]
MTTSRIARKPVVVPAGVDIKIQDGHFTAKGSKGQLSMPLHEFVVVTKEANEINVRLNVDENQIITGKRIKLYRSIAGTVRAKIYNLVHGVSQGFERKLSMVGVGYRAQAKGKVLSLSLGFSHPTDYDVPEGITIETPTQTEIVIKGADKQKVGLVASEIRKVRPPEPYKGKGVRYAEEVVEIKETKKK